MNYEFDLMISYCWAEKAICKKIFERLHTEGYRIWFDEKNMHGNTISAMAAAIENSQCIIICMSENYEKSNACHHEAEFAYVRQRHIVPLVVQAKYRPRQWLGFIVGACVYVDFAKHEFDRAIGMVEAEMKAIQKTDESKPAASVSKKQDDISKDPRIEPIEKKQLSSVHETKRVDEWTSDDVISWCYTHHLVTFVQLLEHFDGASLLRLHTMGKNEGDNAVFRSLQEDCQRLGKNGEIKLAFTEFVRFQTELDKRLDRDAPQRKTIPAQNTKTGAICSLL